MFSRLYRYLIIIVSLMATVFFFLKEDYLNMSMMLGAAILIFFGHYRYGTVYEAFQYLKKENYVKAEKLINQIYKPEWLAKGQKSYFHFTKGVIATQKDNLDLGFSELSKALELGLRTENDTSIVLLNLANIELERKNMSSARGFITKVRSLNLKPGVLSEANRIDNEINEQLEGS